MGMPYVARSLRSLIHMKPLILTDEMRAWLLEADHYLLADKILYFGREFILNREQVQELWKQFIAEVMG